MHYDYNKATLAARVKLERIKPNQNIDINELFFASISNYLKYGQHILDIGTGNGFVLSEIVRRNPNLHLTLHGVDNSKEMVSLAQKKLGGKAIILKADASHLPFADRSFDLLTAKNVTRIHAGEIYRVLKPGGIFVFREYGRGKGLCEITSLFPNRIIRQRDSSFYVDILSKAGLHILSLNCYTITRKYESIENLITIVKSFPFIENFSQEDKQKIIKNFHDPVVTSDPFILACRKEQSL